MSEHIFYGFPQNNNKKKWKMKTIFMQNNIKIYKKENGKNVVVFLWINTKFFGGNSC